ncbi:unnamed protein product [Effrenium voratum]|uniref:At4g15545-like C-terminal domain-containing protein n=1 Tax=Effrenium voratum TaxID=2562239 RepID=A0AA36MX10_9DINO|nr:unnamed protein product [Effrenium voratum]
MDPTPEGVDRMLAQMEVAYRRVETCTSRVKLESAEINLLKVLEQARDVMTASLMSVSRELLQEVFGGSCFRTAKIRAVLDALRLSPDRAGDLRLQGCRNACESVEQVLKDLGLGAALRKAQEAERQALAQEAAGGAASAVVGAAAAAAATAAASALGGSEEAARKAAAEEEAARKAVQEEAARKAAEEKEAARKAAEEEEAARKAAEEEEAARKAAEEEEARKAAEEEAARKAAEEEAARKAAEEEAARKAAEEEAARKAAEEEAARKVAEEEAARRAAEEEATRKAAEEEAARKAAEEEAARKAAEEEAARKAAEEEAARKAAAEEAARKAAEEEAARKAVAEEAARKAAEEEAVRKASEEDEDGKKHSKVITGHAKGKGKGLGGAMPARPLCHEGRVPLCRIGCKRQVAPGVTRHGKPFDTCCRGCALGRKEHDVLCGKIDPTKVGPGKCKMGCSLAAARGRDSSGLALDTCCRGCARGEGHDEMCGQDIGEIAIPYADASDAFFQRAKSEMALVQYNQMLAEVRQLNRKAQTVDECLDKCKAILASQPELLAELQRLLVLSAKPRRTVI